MQCAVHNVRHNLIRSSNDINKDDLKNVPLDARLKGCFGVCLCNRDVCEANDRTALHIHGHVYTGVCPKLIEHIAVRSLNSTAICSIRLALVFGILVTAQDIVVATIPTIPQALAL